MEPALGIGHVESTTAVGDELVVVAWYVPVVPVAIAGWTFAVGGDEHPVREVRTGLASEDVSVMFPFASSARHARFGLRIGVRHEELPDHALLRLAPVLPDGRRGTSVFHVHRPRIVRPQEPAVDSIGGGFEYVSLQFLMYFVELAGLRPDGVVLDVGCGIGRMGYALSAYLGPDGRYCGIDVMREAIATGRRTFASFPRFSFAHLDVQNPMYNAAGALAARDVRFRDHVPAADLVVMTSLLTHLLPGDVRHYLAQIRDVLSPSGAALVTAFVVDGEARAAMPHAHAAVRLRWSDAEECWVHDSDVGERATGYDLDRFTALVREAGLRIAAFHPGGWSGRTPFLCYQDVIVLRRS